MDDPTKSEIFPKTAACVCGALTVSASAPPQGGVHACSCFACQRRSGSAFFYSAFFAEGDAAIAGQSRSYRRSSDSGRWQESNFCPSCGCAVFGRLEALPGLICIAVGAFADPNFPAPITSVWEETRHPWVSLPPDTKRMAKQG